MYNNYRVNSIAAHVVREYIQNNPYSSHLLTLSKTYNRLTLSGRSLELRICLVAASLSLINVVNCLSKSSICTETKNNVVKI